MPSTPQAQEVLSQPQLLDGSRMQEAAQEAAAQLHLTTSADFHTASCASKGNAAGGRCLMQIPPFTAKRPCLTKDLPCQGLDHGMSDPDTMACAIYNVNTLVRSWPENLRNPAPAAVP